MGLSKKSQLVGIDIGSHSIKIVQLLQKKKQFELLNAGLVPLPENTFEDGMTKNPNLVSEAVKQLISSEKIKTKFPWTWFLLHKKWIWDRCLTRNVLIEIVI